MSEDKFIVNGRKYSRDTIEMFYAIYCRGDCDACKYTNTCHQILGGNDRGKLYKKEVS